MARKRTANRQLIEGQTITKFRSGVKSAATLDPYERRLIRFLEWYGMDCDSFVNEAKTNPLAVEDRLIKFVNEKKALADKKVIAASTIAGFLKPIRLLLVMNRVNGLSWDLINRSLPKARRAARDRAPTPEEIQKIIDNSDLRGKALTLVFVTSGVREGAIEAMKVKDLTPMKDKHTGDIVAAKLLVYPEDEEEYIAFITPEAHNAVQEYLDFRKKHGESLTEESPLFRDKFDPIYKLHHGHFNGVHVEAPKPITGPAIRKYYNYLFHELGFRNGSKRRHEFSVHGFRKYFKTKAELAGLEPINVEILLGHSVGISDSYYRPTENDLLKGYLKIVDVLTISPSKKLQTEVEAQGNELDALRKEVFNLRQETYEQDEAMRSLADDAKAALPTLNESNAVSVEMQKMMKETLKEMSRLRAEVWALKKAKK